MPAKSPVRTVGFGIAATSLYAVLASEIGPVADIKAAPVKSPGGNPVMATPAVPISPVMMVGPVFVRVDPLRAPNGAAVPRFICNRQLVFKIVIKYTNISGAQSREAEKPKEYEGFHGHY